MTKEYLRVKVKNNNPDETPFDEYGDVQVHHHITLGELPKEVTRYLEETYYDEPAPGAGSVSLTEGDFHDKPLNEQLEEKFDLDEEDKEVAKKLSDLVMEEVSITIVVPHRSVT